MGISQSVGSSAFACCSQEEHPRDTGNRSSRSATRDRITLDYYLTEFAIGEESKPIKRPKLSLRESATQVSCQDVDGLYDSEKDVQYDRVNVFGSIASQSAEEIRSYIERTYGAEASDEDDDDQEDTQSVISDLSELDSQNLSQSASVRPGKQRSLSLEQIESMKCDMKKELKSLECLINKRHSKSLSHPNLFRIRSLQKWYPKQIESERTAMENQMVHFIVTSKANLDQK